MKIIEVPRAALRVQWRLLRLPLTVLEAVRDRPQPTTAGGQVRRAYVEDLVGRAKGLAGFVLGDDRLVTDGQIERAKAQLRVNTVTQEAVDAVVAGQSRAGITPARPEPSKSITIDGPEAEAEEPGPRIHAAGLKPGQPGGLHEFPPEPKG